MYVFQSLDIDDDDDNDDEQPDEKNEPQILDRNIESTEDVSTRREIYLNIIMSIVTVRLV